MNEGGWKLEKINFSYSDLISKINQYIKKLNFGYSSDLIKNKIKYFNSYASFLDEHTIELVNQ